MKVESGHSVALQIGVDCLEGKSLQASEAVRPAIIDYESLKVTGGRLSLNQTAAEPAFIPAWVACQRMEDAD